MRIISGELKGRHIAESKGFKGRPTTDFAKESLFNYLNNYYFFDKIKVLDLFSGTGSISFEFASRGCKQIELIENDFKNYKLIVDSINELNIKTIRPIKTDVFKFLDNCYPGYDVIFADPPYELKGIEVIPDKVMERELLNENGMFVMEHSKQYHFQHHKSFKEERKYGAVHFSVFCR